MLFYTLIKYALLMELSHKMDPASDDMYGYCRPNVTTDAFKSQIHILRQSL
jgi:hypothetical protein